MKSFHKRLCARKKRDPSLLLWHFCWFFFLHFVSLPLLMYFWKVAFFFFKLNITKYHQSGNLCANLSGPWSKGYDTRTEKQILNTTVKYFFVSVHEHVSLSSILWKLIPNSHVSLHMPNVKCSSDLSLCKFFKVTLCKLYMYFKRLLTPKPLGCTLQTREEKHTGCLSGVAGGISSALFGISYGSKPFKTWSCPDKAVFLSLINWFSCLF